MEVRAKKALGQHFLTDLSIAQRIAEALLVPSGEEKAPEALKNAPNPLPALEIGPGMGVLTQYLLQRPEVDLKMVEIDTESVNYLLVHFPQVEGRLMEADFLKLKLEKFFNGQFAVVGNFPYNISSQIFFKILDYKEQVPQVVCMIQKEVAERIAEKPGTKTYGILSVLLQAWYDIEYLFTVGEGAFNPPPKVKSAVIRLVRNSRKELGCDEGLFKTVVKTGFNQRRKTLRNSLKPLIRAKADRCGWSEEQLAEFTTTVEAEVKNNISPNAALRIEKIFVEVGDNVSKGQKLVQLDASGLEQLALQIENQKIEFNRVSELYKVGGASKAELDNAKTALDVNLKAYNNKLENTVMRSPINGVVTARNYDNGDMSGAAPILVIDQIAPVKMNINVSEPYYAKVNKKTEVSVKFDAYGEEEFAANVNIIYPTINAATHTFPVELNIANKDRRVRPGMYGRATVNFGTQSHVVVPDQAVIKQLGSGDYFVYVYNNGKVSYNKVVLGRRMGDKYEIVEGIEPGAQVVIAGQNKLANDVEVEVIK